MIKCLTCGRTSDSAEVCPNKNCMFEETPGKIADFNREYASTAICFHRYNRADVRKPHRQCEKCGAYEGTTTPIQEPNEEDKFTVKVSSDPVNHPSHYTDGKIEVINFIDDKQLNFCRGNAVKYISRAGKKDPGKEVQDLEKAVWYLQHEINKLKAP